MDYEQININTTQNVLVSYEPAGVFDRMLGFILDVLIISVYTVIMQIILSLILTGGEENLTWYYIIRAVLTLPAMMYSLLCEVFYNGQSVGKKVMNIKVIRLDGTQPSFGAYAIRWMLRVVDFLTLTPLVGLIAVMASKNSQRLGDMGAGTTVVKMTPRASLHNTILYKAQEGYKLTYTQVNKLNDRDIAIIKEVYQHCRQSRDFNALLKLATKVKEQMGLEGSTNMSPEQFINVVLADYSQYEFDA
ncbi:MAG: RDD family protein [Bacteroidia bacterium]|nr:RDD family protein [Bacteroidia bacterium]